MNSHQPLASVAGSSRPVRRGRLHDPLPAQFKVALAGIGLAFALATTPMAAEEAASAGTRLIRAYPHQLAGIEGNWLVWKDGTRMAIDDGLSPRPPEALLAAPDLKDMFHWPYPAGRPTDAPGRGADPGRARHQAFFDKMYGNCAKGEVSKHLAEVIWLPQKARQRLEVTRINGVARQLEAVSRELDRLPSRFDRYLVPAAGSFNCRRIAGTNRPSVHGAGIAIDIALRHADYWRWSKPDREGHFVFRNSIPHEIVAVFEKHGFIWGGRWYHYDTMHFEYRPELLTPRCNGEKQC